MRLDFTERLAVLEDHLSELAKQKAEARAAAATAQAASLQQRKLFRCSLLLQPKILLLQIRHYRIVTKISHTQTETGVDVCVCVSVCVSVCACFLSYTLSTHSSLTLLFLSESLSHFLLPPSHRVSPPFYAVTMTTSTVCVLVCV